MAFFVVFICFFPPPEEEEEEEERRQLEQKKGRVSVFFSQSVFTLFFYSLSVTLISRLFIRRID
jgi:hypothetical protein